VAGSQPRKAASTNKQSTGGETIAAALERYLLDLERAPLAKRTRDAYAQHVRSYGAWLGGRSGGEVTLVDPRARDYAARDFKRWLKAERCWKPSSVNLALAAVDHFNRFLGLGPANVKREPLAQAAPRALSEEQQRALLRAAEASRARDRAIVVVLLYTALRLHELACLDVEDVSVSARKGLLVVRSGKGDVYREIPLNRPCRDALDAWIKQRKAVATTIGHGVVQRSMASFSVRMTPGVRGWSVTRSQRDQTQPPVPDGADSPRVRDVSSVSSEQVRDAIEQLHKLVYERGRPIAKRRGGTRRGCAPPDEALRDKFASGEQRRGRVGLGLPRGWPSTVCSR